jgi:diguanylate cyclase (GGDEF)-like protein
MTERPTHLDAEAAQRRGEIETLLQFVDRLSAAGDAAEVLQSVMEVLAPLLSIKRVGIVTNEGDHALSIGLWDQGVWRPGGTKIPLDGSVSGWVIRNRRAWQTEDLAKDPMHFRAIAALAGVTIGASMALPIFGQDGAVLGVLNLHSERTGRPFSEDDVRIAEALARHLALPIERVRLMRELRASEERFRRQAFTDSLTGLHNRAWLMDHLPRALDQVRERARGLALIFLDLDGFKAINDSLGHSFGDEALAATARRLREGAPEPDRVARLGGDEFVVLAENAGSAERALQLAQRLIDAIRHQIQVRGRQRSLTACAGVTLCGPERPVYRVERLLREADIALYAAKARGRAQAALFESRMSQLAFQQIDLETDLQQALERHQLLLHYEPAFDLLRLHEYSAREVCGVEALLRWRHPWRGLLPAGDFIRLAEESGALAPISDWAIDEACRRAATWQRFSSGRSAPPTLAVNLAAAHLLQPGFVERVADLLQAAALRPEALEMEIGERALLQAPDRTTAALGALHDLGVRLALDDFGDGAFSLDSLRRLPVDRVKIGRSLVTALEEDAGARTIVRSMIDLAHALRIGVTAQGIETEGQLTFLRAAGCDSGQGFLLSPPIPAEEIDSLFAGIGV